MDINKINLKSINWNRDGYSEYLEYLRSLSDGRYKDFHGGLTPGAECSVLGVRVPELRRVAKEIAGGDGRGFLDHITYEHRGEMSREEIIIMGLVTGALKLPFGELCQRVRYFAARVKTWDCCDVAVSSFKEIKNYIEEYKIEIFGFLNSDDQWKQRVGIIILLDFYLKDEKNADYALKCVNGVKTDKYYVNMAQAWLIAEAFAKHRDMTKSFLENGFSLGDKVLKMTVRKLRDSYRVSEEDKAWAQTL